MTNEDFELLCLIEDMDNAIWSWSIRENDSSLSKLSWKVNGLLNEYEQLLDFEGERE